MTEQPPILHGRLLDIEGTFNFRDAGNLPTADGGRLAANRIYRSASLDGLSDQGLAAVADLGIRTVIDLRGANEVETHGSFPVEHFSRRHYPIDLIAFRPDFGPPAGDVDENSATAELRRKVFASDDPMSIVFTALVGAFDQPLVESLRLVADPAKLPAVFHCTSGKDRTGYLAAVIQTLLGVGHSVVVEDFIASAHFADIVQSDMETRYPEMLALPVEKRAQMSTMQPRWLEDAFARMGGRDNVDNFVAGLGFSPHAQATLRNTLDAP